MNDSRFPFRDRPRLWGTAVSHYQVEGDDECDWSVWERAGRTRERCGAAVGSWERYGQDADLAAEAGANSFRFSVSWSRIEPRLGIYDDASLDRYQRLVAHLVRIGLEPVVTLFHYTHPTWFHDRTPWTSPRSVDRFLGFTRRVVGAFGDRVRFYVPLNEPLVFLLAGYFDAQIPPGIADPRLFAKALDNMLAAHCAAAAVIRELQPTAAIAVAHNMMAFAPERAANWLDRLLTGIAHRSYNRSIVEAFAIGEWDFFLPPATTIRGRRDDLTRSLDLFGVNFYSRLHLRCPGRRRFLGEFRYRDGSGNGLTDNGWEIVSEALEDLLVEASESGFPLAVLENGVADAEDRFRSSFITSHLEAIRRVEARGIPIHGYFHWSLLDNFEWLDGFDPKFGLYAVDRTTMERHARPSVETFRLEGARFVQESETSVTRSAP